MATVIYPSSAQVYTRTIGGNQLIETYYAVAPDTIFVLSGSNLLSSSYTTASYALTASSVGTASYISSSAIFDTFAPYALTASNSISASYALNGGGGGSLSTGSTYPITSSWATNVVNAGTASLVSGSTYPITSSQAISASWAATSSISTFAYNINVNSSGTNVNFPMLFGYIGGTTPYGTAGFIYNPYYSLFTVNTISASTIVSASLSGSVFGTSSWAKNAISSSYLTSISSAGPATFDNQGFVSTYTLTQSVDLNNILTFVTNSIVICPNTFPLGWGCRCIQSGSGVISFVTGSGATLNNRQNQFRTAGQYAKVSLLVYAVNNNSASFLLYGDTQT